MSPFWYAAEFGSIVQKNIGSGTLGPCNISDESDPPSSSAADAEFTRVSPVTV